MDDFEFCRNFKFNFSSVLHESNLSVWIMLWIHWTFLLMQEYKKYLKQNTEIIEENKWVI